ncbi:YrbL family protein [Marinobacter daepoensis]|uniref:YrbL family protein n=1 Tax=Marinobacter daepoensis TaxID=262077 RepID=UPI0004021593|nr:YrbL family protein [Marinobacter daepoensis]
MPLAPDNQQTTCVNLDGLHPFAQGANRFCFYHPDDPDRCLKVIRPENIEARYRRQSPLKRVLGKARLNDNSQEWAAHQQPAIRQLLRAGQQAVVWSHLPHFYGSQPTSLGPANASELIRCADGSVAPTLESLLRKGQVPAELQAAIHRFESWLTETRILTRNLLPHNLVVTNRSGQPELFLVDGLGAPTIPQALAALPGWSNHYIARKIARFRLRMAWERDQQGLSWEDFQGLR